MEKVLFRKVLSVIAQTVKEDNEDLDENKKDEQTCRE